MAQQPYVANISGGPFSPCLPGMLAAGPAWAGNGNPNGQISAPVGARYVDLLTGNFWQKQQSTGNQGWIQQGQIGQTGVVPIG
jgi:hypothetical protein